MSKQAMICNACPPGWQGDSCPISTKHWIICSTIGWGKLAICPHVQATFDTEKRALWSSSVSFPLNCQQRQAPRFWINGNWVAHTKQMRTLPQGVLLRHWIVRGISVFKMRLFSIRSKTNQPRLLIYSYITQEKITIPFRNIVSCLAVYCIYRKHLNSVEPYEDLIYIYYACRQKQIQNWRIDLISFHKL